MDNDTLLTRVYALLQRCNGWEGSEVAKDRELAWNYYLQRPRGDEVPKRSPVVSGDVSSMVEAVLASMVDAFETDTLCEFCAYGESDENQAQLESTAVSRLIMQDRGWYQLTAAVKNALLLRNAIAKVRVRAEELTERRDYENLDPLAHAALEDSGVQFASYDPDTQRATVLHTRAVQRLELSAVHPENFLYVEWPLEDFENIPAVAERHVATRQQLIDVEGFPADKVNKLIADHSVWKSDAAVHAVRRYDIPHAPIDKAQEPIVWYEVYALIDGERRRVCVSGNTLLDDSPAPERRPPYAVGVVFINPGKLTGISLFDKVRTTQDVTTGLQRALLDGVNAVVMNRLAVLDGAVSNDQLTDNDPSGVLQVRASIGDVRAAVQPLQVPDASQGILANLAYQRQVRAEMGGASLDISTAQVQLPERVGSMGLDRAYSATEQLAALALKTICQTLIRDVWLLAHATLRREWAGEVNVQIEGRWIATRPIDWPARDHVQVKPGMSPGERRRRSEALAQVIQRQEALAQQGMEDVLVDAERYYRAVCDWGRLNDLKHPERYFIDPATEGAQEALAAKAQLREQQLAAAKQLQEQALLLEQLRTAVEKYGIDVRAAVEYFKAGKDEEAREAELVVDLVKTREAAAAKPVAGESNGPTTEESE